MSTEKQTKSPLVDIINRLRAALRVDEDQKVAEMIGMTNEALSKRKSRNSVPHDKISELCRSRGLDVNWIIYGDRQQPTAAAASSATQQATPDEIDEDLMNECASICEGCPDAAVRAMRLYLMRIKDRAGQLPKPQPALKSASGE